MVVHTSKGCGDAVAIHLPPESVRRQMYFALNPKNAIYNPITGEVNKGVELQESVYLLTYKLLGVKPIDNPIVDDIQSVQSLKFDERFDYGIFDPRN